MIHKVLIVKNITREGPGLFEELLKQHKLPYDIIDLYKQKSFPDPTNYAAVFVCGGPDSANDQTPKMIQEVTQVKKIIKDKIPYLGACLGMQVLVKAAGGKSIKSPLKEVGFRDPYNSFFKIELTETGNVDPLFAGLPISLNIFHLHGETVELSSQCKLLARGKFCEIQAIKIGENQYGFQGHFELTPQMYKIWIAEDPDLLLFSKKQLLADYHEVEETYEQIGKAILTNFLKIAKLIQ